MAVKVERVVDAAVEHVVEYEVHRLQVRQLEALHARRPAVREVTALYCCGPAGGGGVRTALKPTLGTLSCLLPREHVRATFEMLE